MNANPEAPRPAEIDPARWIARRMAGIEASGIRRAFELARGMTDPVDLSIGLPDFDIPETAKDAAVRAVRDKFHAYTLTQGWPELRETLRDDVRAALNQPDRELLVTSGTAGGLTLALCATVDPGDQVLVPDPYFVMYNNVVALAGGESLLLDTHPTFILDPDRVARAITPRVKAIILNSPGNPTGAVQPPEILREVVEICRRRGVLVISDEVYSAFSYDAPFASPAANDENVLVLDGFSKSHAMTGWRLGFAHGPAPIIREMAKLQQFTFICAPSISQKAGLAAWRDKPFVPARAAEYKAKRDRVVAALADKYPLTTPAGAFYAYPQVPPKYPDADAFVQAAIARKLLVIPGNVFSRRNTHFRLSYAVDDQRLERGLQILRELAE